MSSYNLSNTRMEPMTLKGNNNFLESNSIVSKFAFILFTVILFIIVLRFGIEILSNVLKPSSSPHLLNNL